MDDSENLTPGREEISSYKTFDKLSNIFSENECHKIMTADTAMKRTLPPSSLKGL